MSRRTTRLVTSLVTVLLLVAVWWLQNRDTGTPEPDAARDTPSTSAPRTSAPQTSAPQTSAPRTSAPRTSAPADSSGLPTVDLADLPSEAAETVALIDAGGPFPYPGKDGSTFGNFERLLPARARGYYAEYTVPTPGAETRGARRIIAGDGGELYWTEDHYESFERIRR